MKREAVNALLVIEITKEKNNVNNSGGINYEI